MADVPLRLPSAEHQTPECGACGRDTTYEDEGVFICETCQLAFTGSNLTAEYLDPRMPPCNEPCTNVWHKPEALRAGLVFDCVPCSLPANHTSAVHWHGCTARRLEEGTGHA